MFRGFLGACLVLMATAPTAAQSTRVEAIAEEQEKKAGHLGVEGPGGVELFLRRRIIDPLLAGASGVHPWIGSVFSGNGTAVGAGYLQRLPGAAFLNVTGGITPNKSVILEGAVSAPELLRGQLRFDGRARWFDAKGVNFYGLGQDSRASDREGYRYRPTEFGGDLTLMPQRKLTVSGGYSWLDIDSERRVPVAASAPGIGESLRYNVARGTVAFDWRTSPGYSTRGGFYRATINRHAESSGRPFSFRTEEYEVVQLVPLVREQFVLAFRGLATSAEPDAGHDVPVMLGPFLGSRAFLRGFGSRRFNDRHRLLLTGEYRWRPSRYLDMALFLDAGQVAAERRQLQFRALDTSWGIGARFHGPTFTAFRIELARGREGFALIFSGAQAF